MNINSTILRFAPSPTGDLHIGSIRTLLFNHAYRLKTGGKLFLRIDDTDIKRSSKEHKEFILKACQFLGIQFDGYFEQRQRLDVYEKYLAKLLKTDRAYYCVCTDHCSGECRNNNHTDGAVRFRVENDERVKFDDKNFGPQETTIGDFTITRRDGTFLYLFASIVDDIDMEITHIIRGVDHLANTAKQALILRALGCEEPSFIHIPLLHNEDGTKMSKRDNDASFKKLMADGFLKETVINFLLRLGWSSKNKQEYFDLHEVLEDFTFKNFQTAPAKCNFSKLKKINKFHIGRLGAEEVYQRLIDLFGNLPFSSEAFRQIYLPIIVPRAHDLHEVYAYALPLSQPYNSLKNKLENTQEGLLEKKFVLQNLSNILEKQKLDKSIQEFSLDKKKVYGIIRKIITGHEEGPDFFVYLRLISQEELKRRIEASIQ